jgi:diaminopimelate dehydrogenase
MSIRIGIMGYGNIGKGVEMAVSQNKDMEVVAIFTRRNPKTMKGNHPFVSVDEMDKYTDRIDVMMLCGGSATDLPEQGPRAAALFNTVDSFDTHARIPEYFEAMDKAAVEAGHLSLISGGWDPGLFSMMRVLAQAVLPQGSDATFWGPGVSQGHSDAIRRIPGVKDARQYTMPVETAVQAAREGRAQGLTTRQKHTRVCYVVAEEGADCQAIQEAIVTMPNYFADYDTTVHFVDEATLQREHQGIPHGGFVIRNGVSAADTPQTVEFSLKLGSNPEFTSSVLVACARAVYRLRGQGRTGAQTMLDLPIGLLSPLSDQQLRARMV